MVSTKYLLATLAAAIPSALALTEKHCSPMPAGSCTVTLEADKKTDVPNNAPFFPVPHNYVQWTHSQIYDHDCNEISDDARPYEGADLFSSLPYSVHITRLVDGHDQTKSQDWNNWNFCYGDQCVIGGAACVSRIINTKGYLFCQRAFTC